jgi:hypothetical protein
MNYRNHFQPTITRLQRMLDDAMFAGDWGAYLVLRHRMIEIKEHVIAHESTCGYECNCEPDTEWLYLINSSISRSNP